MLYALYVKGRALLLNYTEANMRQAIEGFEQALALDQNYALARAGLATACAWFSVRYAYGAGATEWGARAEREARAALGTDARWPRLTWRSPVRPGRCIEALTGARCWPGPTVPSSSIPRWIWRMWCGCAPSTISGSSTARPRRDSALGS